MSLQKIKMKKPYLVLTVILLPLLFTAQSQQEKINKEEFREISKSFMGNLKSVLMKNLKEGGPTQAITVCSDTAQALTKQIGEQNNVELKRVTFKARNPLDKPDQFEEKVLTQFHELHKKGELQETEDYLEIVEMNGSQSARYMKPIFVGGPCLACHGDETIISDEVQKLLKEKYPNDKATGYKPGDLRGAISITKKL